MVFSVLSLTAACCSCGSEMAAALGTSAVETVRGGVLTNYDSTTVGKAFEGTFQNAKWSSFDTPKGQTIVQFDGTVLAGLLWEVTAAQLADPSAFQAAFQVSDTKKDNCIASLGVAEPIAELRNKDVESEKEYQAALDKIKIDLGDQIKYGGREAYVYVGHDCCAYPFRELEAARRAERAAEQQAFVPINERIATCLNSVPVPVRFQFALAADKHTFKVSQVDRAFRNDVTFALRFVYK